MIPLLLCAAIGVATSPAIQDPPKYEMATFQFVMLVAPPNRPTFAPEAIMAMQEQHVKRLESLWQQRKAIAVGPVASAGPLRGIVILDVRTKEEASALMRDDPFIKSGLLEAQVRPWLAAKGVVRKAPKFMDLEPVWLGILKRPSTAPEVTPEEGKILQEGHMANINKMADAGALIWAGPFKEDTDHRGVFIFRGIPKEKVLEMANEDPAIQAGRLTLELYPWHTSKGTWPALPKS